MERSLCGKSGSILVEWTSNTASEGSGISRWAVIPRAAALSFALLDIYPSNSLKARRIRHWPECSGRTEYCLSLAREIKAKPGSQAITKNRQLQKTEGEFILCNGMEGNFRHRCVAGAFSLVTFFWAPKESDKAKGNVRNAKCKRKNAKFKSGGLVFLESSLCGESGRYPG